MNSSIIIFTFYFKTFVDLFDCVGFEVCELLVAALWDLVPQPGNNLGPCPGSTVLATDQPGKSLLFLKTCGFLRPLSSAVSEENWGESLKSDFLHLGGTQEVFFVVGIEEEEI